MNWWLKNSLDDEQERIFSSSASPFSDINRFLTLILTVGLATHWFLILKNQCVSGKSHHPHPIIHNYKYLYCPLFGTIKIRILQVGVWIRLNLCSNAHKEGKFVFANSFFQSSRFQEAFWKQTQSHNHCHCQRREEAYRGGRSILCILNTVTGEQNLLWMIIFKSFLLFLERKRYSVL